MAAALSLLTSADAPTVLIYNTADAGYALLDQIQLNTTGDVTLGPQDSGIYHGLTIYQRVGERMSGYTFQEYSAPKTPQDLVGDIDDTTTTLISSSAGTIAVDDFIRIDSETMHVTLRFLGGMSPTKGAFDKTLSKGAVLKAVKPLIKA